MQSTQEYYASFETSDWETGDSPLGQHPYLEPLGLPGMDGFDFYPWVKRGIDFVVALLLLCLLAIPLLLIAVAIQLESPGPALFTQTRCGVNGARFRFWKFRSMIVDAEAVQADLEEVADKASGIRFKMSRDPRVTRVGRFIRKYSIDELPQLWNVLLGDMTLVGPRPPLPAEVAQYTDYDFQRLAVTPGITCTWQISGRSEIPFTEQVEMDLDYIQQRSLMSDLLILLKTPVAVLAARGAY